MGPISMSSANSKSVTNASTTCSATPIILDTITNFVAAVPELRGLSSDEVTRLAAGLKATCIALDRIADRAVEVRFNPQNAGLAGPALDRKIHRAQRDLVVGLCPLNLAQLTMLTSVTAAAFVHMYGRALTSNHI
ncbi:3461b834-315c-4730-8fa6-c8811fb24391 [Thermothielavioides terrestris]|uniref:3461b834-315c-4730-8fa6-c8811fb24391 n=1 Tax=Thermothielavioides terrestris TaxID=2587410 RepID=A0A3S4B1U4_9PEZI|nr:3461b834-315c-4730-8fa6-c8811fb24391 [Thermothielavioides terrestris]